MSRVLMSFQTPDGEQSVEWSKTGYLLLHRLGDVIELLGFAVDYNAGFEESDWLFAARRDGVSFAVVLALMAVEPCRWFLYLEGEGFKPLDAPEVAGEVHPVMQSSVESHPGVSHVRWHEDHTTLREV